MKLSRSNLRLLNFEKLDIMINKKLFFFSILALLIGAGCQKIGYNFGDLPETVKGFFSVSAESFEIGEEITFTNLSENATSFSWDFGDGTKSTEKDPKKTYAEPGTYTVTLKAVGPGGTGRYVKDIPVIDPDAGAGSGKELFFIEYGERNINSISLSGGDPAELIANISGKGGVGLAYDSVNKKIYFTDFETGNQGKVWRMDLDGSNMEELVSGIDDPYSIALNLEDGKMYWADDDGNISRADLDGGNLEREFIRIDGGQMRAVAYDSKNKVIYFYEVDDENLYVASANGTGVVPIIQRAYGYGIFVDEVNEKLYYEDRRNGGIMMANLDGSGAVKIAEAPSTRVHGMAIDYSENKFYWADRDKGQIKRANLDGSDVENFLSNLKSPRGIFIK